MFLKILNKYINFKTKYKMTKKTILIILTTLLIFNVHAQNIRHVSGNSSAGASYVFIENGFGLNLNYTHYIKSNVLFRNNFHFEYAEIGLSNYRLFAENPEALYTIADLGSIVFFNAKAGFIAGIERMKNTTLDKMEQKFIIGEEIGFNIEVFIHKGLQFNIDAGQRLFQFSKIGNKSYLVKAGFNYLF